MLDLLDRKQPAWLLGLVAGLLVFMAFLAIVSIAHRNAATYPRRDADLVQVHKDQCERPGDQARIVEVQDTLSNAAYALAGAFILVFATAWAGRLLGLNLLLLSITSGLYHATLSHLPQVLDVAWVYAALLSLSTYVSFAHTRAASPYGLPPLVLGIVGGVLLLGCIAFSVLFDAREGFAFLMLALLVAGVNGACYASARWSATLVAIVAPALFLGIPALGFLMRNNLGWDSDAVFPMLVLLLLVQLFLLFYTAGPLDTPRMGWEIALVAAAIIPGFVVRLGDGYTGSGARHFLCNPDGLVQAHALWHILSALGLLLAYDLVAQFQRDGSGARVPTVLFPAKPAEIN